MEEIKKILKVKQEYSDKIRRTFPSQPHLVLSYLEFFDKIPLTTEEEWLRAAEGGCELARRIMYYGFCL